MREVSWKKKATYGNSRTIWLEHSRRESKGLISLRRSPISKIVTMWHDIVSATATHHDWVYLLVVLSQWGGRRNDISSSLLLFMSCHGEIYSFQSFFNNHYNLNFVDVKALFFSLKLCNGQGLSNENCMVSQQTLLSECVLPQDFPKTIKSPTFFFTCYVSKMLDLTIQNGF